MNFQAVEGYGMGDPHCTEGDAGGRKRGQDGRRHIPGNFMKHQMVCVLLVLAVGASLLTGCQRTKAPEPVKGAAFAMDTAMNFTLYSEDPASGQEALAELTELLGSLDGALSVTGENSDISRVNRSGGRPVEVTAWTGELLSQALALCQATAGALDVTAYPAVKAWGFTTEEHRVPPPGELAELAANIDYTAVRLEGNTVALPAGMELDLGAAAKGYAGDLLAQKVRENGISSALLDLGQSTIAAVGIKPDGSPWRIGVREPDGDSYFAVIELADMAIGTSGGYQRYFEQDGVTYWHILDPKTAAPARSGLTSVTVVSPSALVCDGLSTALFVMGLEEGAQFWRDHPELDFEAVFMTEDGSIYRTAGLEESFSTVGSYGEAAVLE